jgi:hypothetical protein
MVSSSHEEWLFVAYMALFSVFYLIGSLKQIEEFNPKVNSYRFIGSVGSVVILLTLSFNWFWLELLKDKLEMLELLSSQEFILSVFLILINLVLYRSHIKDKERYKFHPLFLLSFVFLFTFLVAYSNGFIAQVLINILVLTLGLYYVISGARSGLLGQMNFGLLIITALIICRFFDSNITFIIRGLLFIAIGVGFFMLNYRLLKKRQNDE